MSNDIGKNLEAATRPFKERLLGSPRVIEVKQWPVDGAPMKLYIWPATMRERAQIQEYRGLERLVATVVFRAKDENRQPRFHKLQLDDLMGGVDPDVIGDLVMQIERDDQGPDDVAGESKLTPS